MLQKIITRSKLLFLILFTSCPFIIWAQQAPLWTTQFSDHHYVRGFHFNSSGNILYTGFIYQEKKKFGEPKEILLGEMDKSGNLGWEKTILGPSYESGTIIMEAPDGTLALFGSTRSREWNGVTSHGSGDVFMLRLTAEGELISNHFLGNKRYNSLMEVKLVDDGYLVTGFTEFGRFDENSAFDSRDAYLAKIDLEGNLLWMKEFGMSRRDGPGRIVAVEESSYLVRCTMRGGTLNVDDQEPKTLLVRFDKQGNQVWQQVLDGNSNDFFLLKDGYLMASSLFNAPEELRATYGKQCVWVAKLDLEGSLVWKKYYGDQSDNTLDEAYLKNGKLHLAVDTKFKTRRGAVEKPPTLDILTLSENGEVTDRRSLLTENDDGLLEGVGKGLILTQHGKKVSYFEQ